MRFSFRPRVAFLFLALMVASLISDGPYVQMAGLLLTWVVCLSTPASRASLCNRSSLLAFIAVLAVISVFFLYCIVFPNPEAAPALEKSATNNYLFMILTAIFVFSLMALISTEQKLVASAFAVLLVVNDAVMLMQTAILTLTHRYIDFVQPVTGEMSRYRNYEDFNPIFAYRPTGLYVEPSTFSAAVGVMAIGYILLCRAQGRQPNKYPIALTIACMLISQSTAAIVQGGILIIAVMLMQKKRVRLWAGSLIALVLVASPALLINYFNSFVLKLDATSGIRLTLLHYIYQVRQGWDFVFGFGPFLMENPLYRMAATSDAQVASLNDAGLLHYFVAQFGIVGLLIPIAMFLKMHKDVTTVLFFAVIMTSKLSYMTPVLFLGLLPLLMELRDRGRVARTAGGNAPPSARLARPLSRRAARS